MVIDVAVVNGKCPEVLLSAKYLELARKARGRVCVMVGFNCDDALLV
jgi:hypothetical protein